MTNLDAIIGVNIRVLRKKRGFSQEKFAKVLGVHQASLSRIEAGQRGLTIPELVKAAKLFALPIDWFLVNRGNTSWVEREARNVRASA